MSETTTRVRKVPTPTTLVEEATVAARLLATPLEPGQGLDHQIKPWLAMGALFLSAGAARVAIEATGHDAEVAWGTSSVAFVLAVVVAFASKRRLMPRRLRSRFLVALYLGATWVTGVAHLGMTIGAVAVLTVVGASLSLAFWAEHRIDNPGPETMPVIDDSDIYVERWAANMGSQGKPLSGSRLRPNPEMIRAGYKYTLELVPGSQTVTGAMQLGDQLRGALRLQPGQEVIVEVHPTEPAPTALLTIVTKSPVKQSRPWPGVEHSFDRRTGSVNLGPFIDDEGVAQWKVYVPNGIFGGFMQGDPGSGKSRMFESIAMSLAASESHPTVVWFACGQRGASSPMLVEHADWVATTPEEFHEMLLAATRLYKKQSTENRLILKVPGFTPMIDRPGLVIFVDELHGLVDAKDSPTFGPANQRLMLRIVQEARKAGVAIIAADQSPTLDAFGGPGNGMDTLRSGLINGNGVLLKSETNNAKQVFKVDIDPRRFPDQPGYAFLARPKVDARSAPFRGYHVTDEQIETEPGRLDWRTLTERQARWCGEQYIRRAEIAQAREAAELLEFDMDDMGLTETLAMMNEQMEAADVARAEAAKDDIVLDFADGIPSVRPISRFWMTPSPQRQETQQFTPGELKVLRALAQGGAKSKALQDATGLSESGVSVVVKKLMERGLVAQPQKYGEYQLSAVKAA